MPRYSLGGREPSLPADGTAWVAPSADIIGEVVLGRQVSVWFGAVIRADNTPISIGDGSNVQEGAVLHSDPGYPLTIGANVTVGHRVVLHGCTIGDRALIGMGSIILNGAVIGDDCIVGAGALVTQGKVYPAGHLVTGSPATIRRPLTPAEIANLTTGAEEYVAKAEYYRREFAITAS